MPDAQARGNLRHALSRIRKALPGPPARLLDGPSVALDPSVVDVDVARFERLVADGRPAALEQVAGLYRGDLLAGLALAERPFEEWLTSERERLHELAIQGLGRLLTHQQKAGAAEPAVQTGLRLLALDPLQEPVHRAVMRLYARLGRREAALRQYQLCVDALKRELGTAPEAETTQLFQEIHALASRPSRPTPASGLPAETSRRPDRDLASPRRDAAGGPAADESAGADLGADRPSGRAGGGDGAAGGPPARHADRGRGHRQDAAGPGGRAGAAAGLRRRRVGRRARAAVRSRAGPGHRRGRARAHAARRRGVTGAGGDGARREAPPARAGQLRARDRGGGAHGRGAAARRSARARAGDQPRAAARAGRVRLPGALARRCRRRAPRIARPLLEAAAVKLFVARAQAMDLHFSLDARTRGDRRRDLSAARRHPARDRAGGGPHRHARGGRARRPPGRSVPAADGRPPDRAAAPPDAAGDARLELRAAPRDRAHGPAPPGRLRRRLHAGGGERGRGRPPSSTRPTVVDSVANLAAKSLVVVEAAGAVTRYRLLETTRAYALEKLTESGELDHVARRHAEYYRDLFERAETERGDAPHRRVAGRLRPADRQRADRAGLGLLPARRRVDRRGAHRRGGAPLVPAVAPGRVSRPRRARARQPRASPGARRAPRDAALRRARGVAHAHEGGGARHHRGLDHRPRDRRAPRRHRVPAPGALGPLAFPRQPR